MFDPLAGELHIAHLSRLLSRSSVIVVGDFSPILSLDGLSVAGGRSFFFFEVGFCHFFKLVAGCFYDQIADSRRLRDSCAGDHDDQSSHSVCVAESPLGTPQLVEF